MNTSRLLEAWSSLEAYRQQAEGDPAHGAFVGAILGALIEGGRFASHLVQGVEDKLKGIEARISRIVSTPTPILVKNLRRQASSTPSISSVASSILSGGGSVTKLATSTNTDQAARIRVLSGSGTTAAAAVVARVNFSTPFDEAPVVMLRQEAGGEAALRPVAVTTTGFDVLTGAGLGASTTYDFVYVAIPTVSTVPVA